MVSVSEDCLVKLWNLKTHDSEPEPIWNFRGHTGPLFAVTSSINSTYSDLNLIYSAGKEGLIRIWQVPKKAQIDYEDTDGENFCKGVWKSHKDVIW
jgi:WD40 repeat protein